jgi:hypothetical protein
MRVILLKKILQTLGLALIAFTFFNLFSQKTYAGGSCFITGTTSGTSTTRTFTMGVSFTSPDFNNLSWQGAIPGGTGYSGPYYFNHPYTKTITFPGPGTYTLHGDYGWRRKGQTVIQEMSCSRTITVSNPTTSVPSAPYCSISMSGTDPNRTYTINLFNASATGYYANFGSGASPSTSTSRTTSVTYTTSGSKTVNASVSYSGGSVNCSRSTSITVADPPATLTYCETWVQLNSVSLPDFSSPNNGDLLLLSLTNVQPAGANVTSLIYDVVGDDTGLITNPAPTPPFGAAWYTMDWTGNDAITITTRAQTNNGAWVSCAPIRLIGPTLTCSSLAISASNVQVGQQVSVAGQWTVDRPAIYQYVNPFSVDWGNGVTTTPSSYAPGMPDGSTYAYPSPGVYNITLTTQLKNGVVRTCSVGVTVSAPVANTVYCSSLVANITSGISQNRVLTVTGIVNSGGVIDSYSLVETASSAGGTLIVPSSPNNVFNVGIPINLSNVARTYTFQANVVSASSTVLAPSSTCLISITMDPQCGDTTILATDDCDGDGINNGAEGFDPNGDGDVTDARDTDSDGIPDYLDQDSDNDSIPDQFEGNIDTDGDSTPNYLDLDSDNDGIPDSYEEVSCGGVMPCIATDTDGDGIYDFLDQDSDGDNIRDSQECPSYSVATGCIDSNGNGLPDYQDLDSDGDGISDDVEDSNCTFPGPACVPTDSDGDGIPNHLDLDSDNDIIPDSIEQVVDTDEDSIPDYLDLDSDGDSIPDQYERGLAACPDINNCSPVNTDGSTNPYIEPDYLDLDSDDDGIPDSIEDSNCTGTYPCSPTDTDGDGVPNHLDPDSDNDGIPDSIENPGCTGILPCALVDTDGDSIPNYLDTDSDGDGIPDSLEDNNCNGSLPCTPTDTDNDGTPDYLDLDADNDGIPDSIENPGCTGILPCTLIDTDNDGIPNFQDPDSDNDGLLDIIECPSSSPACRDTDGDGIPDYLDLDSDGDNLSDQEESTLGIDNQITNYLNPDTDGDGTRDDLDFITSLTTDATGNNPCEPRPPILFVPSGNCDTDNDGIPDSVERANGDPDTDGDGIPNFNDPDSDGDGILDVIEKGPGCPISNNTCVPTDTDGDGTPDYLDIDSDGDNIPDQYETNADTDLDGIPNYLDIDSDGDGIPDDIEDSNCNGTVPCSPTDTDGDGTPDYLDIDSDGDNIPDSIEDSNCTGTLPCVPSDTDGDGIPNHLDPDSDGDGIPDDTEDSNCNGTLPCTPTDTDSDGIPDYLDPDSDNDNIPDNTEDSNCNGSLPCNPTDTDGDGIPNHLDPDSDNDGIPDDTEDYNCNGTLPCNPTDSDGDGTPNYIDPDSDNDGYSDNDEDYNCNGVLPCNPTDTDNDGLPDYIDPDSDDDGVVDKEETTDGRPNSCIPFGADGLPGVDCDNDGLPVGEDVDDTNPCVPYRAFGAPAFCSVTIDRDGDGIPNSKDPVDDDPCNPNLYKPIPTADCDYDALTNRKEIRIGTNWLNPDTDYDTYKDGREVYGDPDHDYRRSNPLDACDPTKWEDCLDRNERMRKDLARLNLLRLKPPMTGSFKDPKNIILYSAAIATIILIARRLELRLVNRKR